jgi:carboxyl-terminal processing protease
MTLDPTAADPGPAEPPVVGEPIATEPARRSGDRTLTIVALALAIVAVLAGAALFLSGYSIGRQAATTPGTPVSDEELFAPFWDSYNAIVERYAGGPVDKEVLVEGAIDGMFDALGDPYSSYLTDDEYRASLENINGQFEGVGAEISTEAADGSDEQCSVLGPECHLVIVAPIAGSPAEEAGLRPGDLVLAVDGRTLDGLTVDEARDRIRGPKGSEVVLTIGRDGGEPFDVAITRDVIQQREVITETLADGDVVHIRVTGFSSDAAADVDADLREAIEAGTTKVILDLRGNPGGFVDAARDIASQFIASGPVYYQEDSRGEQVETEAKPGGAATDPAIELVVLVDEGSASASEIVAGAIQDTGRGPLVGEQTFGKGTVQSWTELEGDNGGFRLTIAKWLTPDKRWIHKEGLTPDVVVEVPADTPVDDDPVLDAALELLGEEPAG